MDSSSEPPTKPSSPPSDSDDSTSSDITQSRRPLETPSYPSHDEHNASPKNSLRHRLGTHLSTLSDLINSNLIVFRYGAMSTILLLGVYGIANTPLFYRYRSVWDIPAKKWKRRWIHGRIVGVETLTKRGDNAAQIQASSSGLSSLLSTSLQKQNSGTGGNAKHSLHSMEQGIHQAKTNTNTTTNEAHRPVIVLFRHFSPMERLLTQKTMDKLSSIAGNSTGMLFSSSIASHLQTRNLIPIELAGITHPPVFRGMPHEGMGLLHQLVQDKTRVSIQLLAQRVNVSCLSSGGGENGARPPISDDILQSTAICHVTYRKPRQWFRTTNVSLELVSSGQATLSSCVVPRSSDSNDGETKIINFDPTPKHLQNDAAFMSQLEQAEYSAWKSKLGVWSLNEMTEWRMEYKQEEDYISNRWSTRLWNAFKRGWGWIRNK
ncbi:hypothetical protein ACHAW6_003103 [Cyclotella cf. meneghiniana]